jgi:hypothetical protein
MEYLVDADAVPLNPSTPKTTKALARPFFNMSMMPPLDRTPVPYRETPVSEASLVAARTTAQ